MQGIWTFKGHFQPKLFNASVKIRDVCLQDPRWGVLAQKVGSLFQGACAQQKPLAVSKVLHSGWAQTTAGQIISLCKPHTHVMELIQCLLPCVQGGQKQLRFSGCCAASGPAAETKPFSASCGAGPLIPVCLSKTQNLDRNQFTSPDQWQLAFCRKKLQQCSQSQNGSVWQSPLRSSSPTIDHHGR